MKNLELRIKKRESTVSDQPKIRVRNANVACGLALALTVVLLPCQVIGATDVTQTAELTDEAWVITTRHLPDPSQCLGELSQQLRARVCRNGVWQSAAIEDFYAGDDAGRVTAVYLPGNKSGSSYAICRGMRLYRSMQASRTGDRAIRMVIWNWPNDKIFGPLRDVRVKEARAHSEAFYLAAFLNRMQPDQTVSLIGYSFGSQIALGGIHLAYGGSIDGRGLAIQTTGSDPLEVVPNQKYRVTLLAAAANVSSLHPNGDFCLATKGISKLQLFYNNRDPILCKYHIVDGQSALGCKGMAISGSQFERMVLLRDASGIVGKSHSEDRYYNSSQFMNAITRFSWWED